MNSHGFETGKARVDVWLLRAFLDQDGYRATKMSAPNT